MTSRDGCAAHGPTRDGYTVRSTDGNRYRVDQDGRRLVGEVEPRTAAANLIAETAGGACALSRPEPAAPKRQPRPIRIAGDTEPGAVVPGRCPKPAERPSTPRWGRHRSARLGRHRRAVRVQRTDPKGEVHLDARGRARPGRAHPASGQERPVLRGGLVTNMDLDLVVPRSSRRTPYGVQGPRSILSSHRSAGGSGKAGPDHQTSE